MKYTKVYTRENCLLAFQVWEEHQTKTIRDILGWSDEPIFFDVQKGVAHVYYHDQTFSEYEKNIERNVSQDIHFIEETMHWYGDILDHLEPVWASNKPLGSREALSEFYDRSLLAWCGLDISYVVPTMMMASDSDKNLTMSMRERAVDFLENIDHVFQRTLRSMYPNLGDLIKYLMLVEVRSGKIPTEETLKKREQHYVYHNSELIIGKDVNQIASAHGISLAMEKIPNVVTELKGQIAMKGVVQGRVKVLRNKSQIPEIQSGEILVTAMTTPDYLPAMKVAAAFITDEGGITCHAAIVARELKKPCIIGTKIATQVLQDGDLVEVDADNGVVRILEQNEDTESSSQMFRNLNPEDFTKTFESEGTKFLFEDLVNTHYMLLAGEGLSILRKTKIVFVNKKSLAEMRAEGENRTTEMTQEKMRFLDALFEEAKSEASVLVNKECLALDEVVRVFRILGAIFAEYFYFDPWYWDGAYELAKSNERMRENITLVQGYKNVARSKFEPVCFGEGNLILILLEKLSVQFDIPVGDLDRYREEEILALFANERVSQEELLARRMLCAFYISPDRKAHFMTGGEVTDVARWFMNEKLDAVTQLKGTPAHSTGAVVTARVYIIRRDYGNKSATEECINRMQQGEVLVSETTDPELIRALKKASAVITDLGGLLSHAAITAREYNLPCIVGVANASKILKDGDLVEVDADNGIIKILKKKL